MGTDGKRFAEIARSPAAASFRDHGVYGGHWICREEQGASGLSRLYRKCFVPRRQPKPAVRLRSKVPRSRTSLKCGWMISGDSIRSCHLKSMAQSSTKHLNTDFELPRMYTICRMHGCWSRMESIILAHSIRDADVDDALIAEMKKHLHSNAFAGRVRVCVRRFAEWVDDPFFTAALDRVLEMITSPEYKARCNPDKVTAQEQAALPEVMRNLKKIYDAGILVSLGTDSGATQSELKGFAEHMELALMVQAGLTPIQAINVATLSRFNCSTSPIQYGTLATGKRPISLFWSRIHLKTFTIRKPFARFGRMATKLATVPLAAGTSATLKWFWER